MKHVSAIAALVAIVFFLSGCANDRTGRKQRGWANRTPISEGQLRELFVYLDKMVYEDESGRGWGCDTTFRHTKHFLEAGHIKVNPVLEWLEEGGGFCDCEVLLNTVPRYDESRKQ